MYHLYYPLWWFYHFFSSQGSSASGYTGQADTDTRQAGRRDHGTMVHFIRWEMTLAMGDIINKISSQIFHLPSPPLHKCSYTRTNIFKLGYMDGYIKRVYTCVSCVHQCNVWLLPIAANFKAIQAWRKLFHRLLDLKKRPAMWEHISDGSAWQGNVQKI